EGAGSFAALLGGGAVLLGSLSYAIGNVYARRRLEGVPVLVSAVGQNLGGVLVVLPFALAFGLSEELPGLGILAALLGLGAGGTGIAYLLYFGLIARVGATKTSTVAYLMPAIALFYGAVFLDEAFTLRAGWTCPDPGRRSRRYRRTTSPQTPPPRTAYLLTCYNLIQ
ncbi:MAG TPA: DMT family transporter, partial [Rubrobacteraceae bacterium]|nr:DMT family transporter [Rubrobacteraceae bacterium]